MESGKLKALWVGENDELASEVGHRVNSVLNGLMTLAHSPHVHDALLQLQNQSYDLVFLDDVGDLQGEKFWNAFIGISREVPVLIVTNGEKADFVLSALKKGACDFIASCDANPESLVKSLRHAIANFKLQREISDLRTHNITFKEQFLASQKMESVGRLALGVAHDFNNLLTVILNYSQMVTSSAKDDDSLRRKMDAITNCAQRAASITSQFLAFGRRNRPKPRSVSLTSTLSIVGPLLKQTLGSEVDLNVIEEETGLNVLMDPNHLMHVMMSMAQISHESMPSGGKIVLKTSSRTVDEAAAQSLGGIASGDYVVISFKDNGRGYDAETIDHIFELFGGGAAEGKAPASLSAVNSIIKHAGGHIAVESHISNGTLFEIYRPRIMEEVPLKVAEPKMPPKEKMAEKILVVDDEEMVRKIAVDVISNYGFRVVEAASAVEALKICEQSSEPIDLVLTDLIMPKMNGPEMVSKIIGKNPDLKVVYMSGYADDAFEHNAALKTKELFVQKPFLPKSLITTLRNALDSSDSIKT